MSITSPLSEPDLSEQLEEPNGLVAAPLLPMTAVTGAFSLGSFCRLLCAAAAIVSARPGAGGERRSSRSFQVDIALEVLERS